MEAKFGRFKTDVEEWSEVHATIEGLGEKDIRSEQAEFDETSGIVTITERGRVHRIDIEHIIHWYKPVEF